MASNIDIHPQISNTEFNALLLDILFLVCNYGISHHQPEKENKLSYQLFMNKVHEGWKKAQDIACGALLAMLDETKEINEKIAARKKAKQVQAVQQLQQAEEIINIRIRKIQYVFNTIPWTIFGIKDHVPRRFYREPQNNINRKTLSEIYTAADQINKDPSRLAILSDLTTFMHVGDLIVMGLSDSSPGLSIVEVKTGSTNSKLLETLEFYEKSHCDKFMQLSAQNMTESERKQMSRILKQKLAMIQAAEVLEKDEGIDLSTNKPVRLIEPLSQPDTFEDKVNDAYKTLSDNKDWAIGTIDECLYFGLYKGQWREHGKVAMQMWMSSLNKDCIYIDFRSAFFDDLSKPITLQPIEKELTDKILTDEVSIYFALCFDDLISECQKNNVDCSFVSRKESERVAGQFGGDLFRHKKQLLSVVNNPSGTKIYINGGIFSRIFYGFFRPIHLIKMIAESSLRDS